MKLKRGIILIIDAVLTGIALIVFALFHHVLPRSLKSEKIVIDTDDNICECKNQEVFSCTNESSETIFKSEGVAVTIETKTMEVNNKNVIYHIADIYIKNIESFQTAFANGIYGKGHAAWMKTMAKENNAVVAINGDYYSMMPSGLVLRNGEIYRKSQNNRDVAILYKNGVLETVHAKDFDLDKAIEKGAWQGWQFGPMLLDSEGKATEDFYGTNVTPRNPRTALCYMEVGHYKFVIVEGRRSVSVGLTMSQLSQLMYDLGCKSAYNFDGGQSSTMYFNERIVNAFPDAEGERTLGDIIYIKEVTNNE